MITTVSTNEVFATTPTCCWRANGTQLVHPRRKPSPVLDSPTNKRLRTSSYAWGHDHWICLGASADLQTLKNKRLSIMLYQARVMIVENA